MKHLLGILPPLLNTAHNLYNAHTNLQLKTEAFRLQADAFTKQNEHSLALSQLYAQERSNQRAQIVQALSIENDPANRRSLIEALTTPLDFHQLSLPRHAANTRPLIDLDPSE